MMPTTLVFMCLLTAPVVEVLGQVSGNVVSSFYNGQASGTSFTQNVDPDGVTRGQCAYIDNTGNNIKIEFEEINGKIQARSLLGNVADPVLALNDCRRQADHLAGQAWQQGEIIRNQIQQQQAHLQSRAQEFHNNLMRQHQHQLQQHENFFRNFSPFFPFRR